MDKKEHDEQIVILGMIRTHIKVLTLGLIVVILGAGFLLFGLLPTPSYALTQQERAELEAELASLEAQIEVQKRLLNSQRRNSSSIKEEVERLEGLINAKKLEISRKNKLITKISGEITEKKQAIAVLNSREERQKESLEKLLRRRYELDSLSVIELLLSNKQVTNFFIDVDTIEDIQEALELKLYDIRDTRRSTAEAKESLEVKKEEEIEVVETLKAAKAKVEAQEEEKEELFEASKEREKTYEQMLAEREAEASKIRAALFELAGVPKGGLPFGEVLDMARIVSDKTGIEPALIMAILKQETNYGANTGTCNRPGDTRTWRDIMPGPTDGSWRDDQTIFQDIVSRLGLEPDGLPLSCPAPWGGYGGAMGVSQFIPYTWHAYEYRVATAMDVAIANPWIPLHGITATGMYMKDLGAASSSWTDQWNAACKYYSGRGCLAPNVKNKFYGDAVMKHKADIQAKIDIIESV